MSVSGINTALQSMQTMASQASGLSNIDGNDVSAMSFSATLQDSLRKVSQEQSAADLKGRRFQMGDPNVSLDDVVTDMQKASLGFTMLTQVRNKVVNAYKEVMSMPI
ncbi:flagellar hook-basal body complex protein FliE [Pseudomonas nitritireducens]|uniref:Flagellar hook-basal body complex protein FliE n=1 Tax=Pseudomonas nitroreducens TaxID=46680 RepID=A0A7W7P3B3_PSENT|nr:flagellar hook-basal body complex protein FliE [Pseudomonas nitritireducens]MBB4865400.1 flagellar hook-basal body complex protein FliE [Pseudomonas nitritireducens]